MKSRTIAFKIFGKAWRLQAEIYNKSYKIALIRPDGRTFSVVVEEPKNK